MSDELKLTVEFTGGLEMLFDDVVKHSVSLPATNKGGAPSNMGYLIEFICDNLLKDPRKELFVLQGTIRPGILVLINDADWELEEEDKYQLSNGDKILFVSTLHGG